MVSRTLFKNIQPVKQFNRLHHVYRPIRYCDWYKPPNSIHYELICPPCPPKPVCQPSVVTEKSCRLCSFWEQFKDNCCGFFWPLPPIPMRSEPRVYVCKDLRKKKINKKQAQSRLERRIFPVDIVFYL